MLYINLRLTVSAGNRANPNNTAFEEKTIEWTKGQGPIADYYDTLKPEVISVFADDQEYEYLTNLFHNIPIVRGKSCVWRGEVAHFIFDNLR